MSRTLLTLTSLVDIIEKRIDFDICFAFMHSDAGMAFAATMSAISKAKLYAVIFCKNAEALAETIEFNCEKIVAKAVHNPTPLKIKVDKVIAEAGLVSYRADEYDLLLERVSFKEAKEFIEKNADEVYYVDPGYKIFKDYYIMEFPPSPSGRRETSCSSLT